MNVLLLAASLTAVAQASPTAKIFHSDVTYRGIERNGIEVFLGIPYAQDTSGSARFAPPKPFHPPSGAVINATKPGLPCPQQLGEWNAPLTLLNVTEVSENCLNLNIARPVLNASSIPKHGLPVMLWIHGGSFWVGSNMEPTTQPDGLKRESMDSGNPVIHVGINYRLGLFGFAQSPALRAAKSENAGLRDQRLAIEWVKDHVRFFGGDGSKITIFGQSSGGLSVGMQLLAYGGTKPLPYHQGIAQSQALEPGIVDQEHGEGANSGKTVSFTKDAFIAVVDHLSCNPLNTSLPQEIIDCLRLKDTQTLLDASLATYASDIAHNIGDIWLPSVDGDFLPDAPSTLLREGRFGRNVTYMFGWCEDDVNYFTDTSIASYNDSFSFLQAYLPGLSTSLVSEEIGLLHLYNTSEITPPAGTSRTAEFYRTARAFRDVLMVCEPLLMADALNRYGNAVYLYNWNQTILSPILEAVYNVSGMGVIHTSELGYIHSNLSAYNVSGYPFKPSQQDYELARRASRTWASFAASGHMIDDSYGGLNGWLHAYWADEQFSPPNSGYPYIYTIGGELEGFSPIDGSASTEELRTQRLMERCGWINTPAIVERVGF